VIALVPCTIQMRIISFIEEGETIYRIIRHLKLTFEAELIGIF